MHEELTERIIGCAIEVHRALGPGLLESACESCLCHQFILSSISFARQIEPPVVFQEHRVGAGFRIDPLIEDAVIVELKSIDRLLPVHEAQLLAYLNLSQKRAGLLINFNVMLLKSGNKRRIL